MNKDYESVYHSVEATHFWNVSRREFILLLLKKLKIGSNARIVDVGCSGGLLIDALIHNGYKNTCGGDISPEAVAKGKARGLDIEVMNIEAVPLPDNSVDVVILSDVIAHVNDETAFSECQRILKPGGTLISFCPAHPWLWSGHDEHNRHQRRYTKRILKSRATQSGFHIKRIGYWNCLLFPLQASMVILKKWRGSNASNYDTSLGATNRLLRAVFWIENRLLRITNLPIGISLFIIAETPSQ